MSSGFADSAPQRAGLKPVPFSGRLRNTLGVLNSGFGDSNVGPEDSGVFICSGWRSRSVVRGDGAVYTIGAF